MPSKHKSDLEHNEDYENKYKSMGIRNRKGKQKKDKKKSFRIKFQLNPITNEYESYNTINPITNEYEMDRSIYPNKKYPESRTYINRGKYRTYMRSSKIDENFITPSIYMRQRNWWDAEAYKPKLFVYK
jgi:hypothetical protein